MHTVVEYQEIASPVTPRNAENPTKNQSTNTLQTGDRGLTAEKRLFLYLWVSQEGIMYKRVITSYDIHSYGSF